MPKIQETRTFSGKPVNDIYQSALTAAPLVGLVVWKRRDIAWLAMIRCGSGSDMIDGNVSVRPGGQVTVSLNANITDEAELKTRAEAIFQQIQKALG